MKKGTPIRVMWLDADMEAGWCNTDPEEEDLPDSAYLLSYGVYGTTGPKFLTMGFAYNEDSEELLGKHRVPVGMIKSITEIEHAEETES